MTSKKEYEKNLGLWCQRFTVVLPHIKMVRGNEDKDSSPVVRRMIRDVSGSGAAHPPANAGLLGPEPEQAVEMLRVVDEALTESLKHRSGLALLQDEFWLDQ